MIDLRKHLAWICSASLWCGTAAWADEPVVSAKTKSEHEPARLQADSEEPVLGIRPVDPADYWQRLERAEAQIAELQTQNQTLRESSSPIQQTGFNPLHMAPLFFAHDPEIGIIREQTSSTSSLLEMPKDPSKPEAPKPKKWFDKLSIRGYAQFRINEVTHMEDGSARPQYVGDRSLADNQSFLIRRARVIISGDVHERVYVYLQPDFASSPGSSADPNNQFAQIRDWYSDLYLDDQKELRVRIGQSKVPYGWENLQSSSNRIPLDRHDALNSAVRNERDLGAYFFYTPTWAQDFFKDVLEKGLKGSGNYGLFSAGVYNGQGGSFNEINDDLHVFARLTLPLTFENGQRMEVGIQGYAGEYSVIGSAIDPPGAPPGFAATGSPPDGTVSASGVGVSTQSGFTQPINAAKDRDGWNDERLAGSFIWYPQPFGFQTEWTIGRGPALNATQTSIEERALYGGYAMLLYKLDTECWGTFFPFARYSYFKGGYKSERNAPFVNIDEYEFGTEWQINPAAELTLSYLITDRTNTTANATAPSYAQFDGQALRLQFQFNY